MFEYKTIDMVIQNIEECLANCDEENLPLLITEGTAPNGLDYCTQVLAMDVTKDDTPGYNETFILCCNFTEEDEDEEEKQLDAQDVLYYLRLYKETYGGDCPVFVSESTHKAGMMPCRYVGIANASVRDDDENAPEDIQGMSVNFVFLANFGQSDLDKMNGGDI